MRTIFFSGPCCGRLPGGDSRCAGVHRVPPQDAHHLPAEPLPQAQAHERL